MDFYRIKARVGKGGVVDVFPDFKVTRSKDLMVRSRGFYAIWDEERGLWSTDEYDVQRLVDNELDEYAKNAEGNVDCKYMSDFSSNSWMMFRRYLANLSDSSHQLDENLTFSNTEVKKGDYVSRRLSYPLAHGDISAYDELVGTLYEPQERAKLEWAIGAIVAAMPNIFKSLSSCMVLQARESLPSSTLYRNSSLVITPHLKPRRSRLRQMPSPPKSSRTTRS